MSAETTRQSTSTLTDSGGDLTSPRDYQIVVPRPVAKQLDNLPSNTNTRIIERVAALKADPRPRGCVKLKGKENEYRIRVGDYRVRYEGRDDERLMLLLYCKHRKDVYKGF